MTRSIRVVAVLAVLCLTQSGCGSGSDTVDRADAGALHKHVATARTALDRGDEASARAAITNFRTAVRTLENRGDLNSDDAEVLRKRADRLIAGIEREESAEAKAAASAEAAADAAAEKAALRALLEESSRELSKEDEKAREKEKGRGKPGKGGDD